MLSPSRAITLEEGSKVIAESRHLLTRGRILREDWAVIVVGVRDSRRRSRIAGGSDTIDAMEHEFARARIRQKLSDGRLPRDSTRRVSGAPTTGQMCDGCDVVIEKGRRYAVEGVSIDDNRPLHFHVACLRIWLEERKAPGQ